jgi:O-antigen ligase
VKPASLDRLVDGAFFLTMPLMAWLAVFGHRGAVVVVGLSALAIALRPGVWREGLPLLSPSRIRGADLPRAAFAGLLFALWIAITGFWSPVPGAPKIALGLAAFTIAGGALVYEASRASERRVRRMAMLFAGAVTAAAALLLFEGLTGGALRAIVPPADQSPLRWKDMTALARGVTFVAPLVFPAAAILFALSGSRLLALAPLTLALLASAQFSVATNIVAILFGLGASALALWRPRAIIVALGALFLASLLSAPLFALAPADAVLTAESALLPPSWAQRVNLWKEAADRVLDGCFLLGCGADYTRAWGAEGAMIDVPGSPIPLKEAPMHPHNLFLQIWLELGILGVLTIGVALSFALRRLASVEPQRLAFAAVAGASAAAYISFMFEASLWQAWRIAVLSLAAFGAALSYSLNGSRRS